MPQLAEQLYTIDIGELSLDDQGRIVACSRGIERMFGVLHHDVIGQPCGWLFHGDEDFPPVDDLLFNSNETSDVIHGNLKDRSGRWLRCALEITRSEADSISLIVRELEQDTPEEFSGGDAFHEQQVEELTRLEMIVLGTLKELVTRNQAIEVFLDNCIDLLPCDLAGVAVIRQDDAESYAISTLENAESGLQSLSNALASDLASFARKQIPILPFSMVTGPSRTERPRGQAEMKSILSMPIFSAGKLAGILAVASPLEGAFSIKEERILTTLSTHLSLALQQLHYQGSLRATIGELENLNRTLARLHSATERINSTRDAEELYDLVLNLALVEMEADNGSLILVDSKSGKLKLAASRGLTEQMQISESLNRVNGVAKWVIDNAQVLKLGSNLVKTRFTSAAEERGILQSAIAPLRLRDKNFGALCVNRTRSANEFTNVQTEAMLMIGNAAAVALDNLQLHQERLEGERIETIGMTVMGIGHYIKNLNTVLQVGRKLIDDGLKRGDLKGVGDAWGTIRRSTDKLTNLSMDLLDYSKAREPMRQRVDIHKLIKDISVEIESVTSHHHIDVELLLTAEPSHFELDRDQIHRSLLNLITNGIDAMTDGGKLSLATRITNRHNDASKPYLELSVSDTGQGIPDDVLPNIFRPMFSTKGSRGTGIGLAVTRKVVEEHGGELELETVQGQGTTFRLLLPLHYSESEP